MRCGNGAQQIFIMHQEIQMSTRIALYAGALLLAAIPPPGNAAAVKADCRYKVAPVFQPADRESVPAEPAAAKWILAERQRQILIAAAMKDREAPNEFLVRALSQVAGQE